MNFFTKQQMSHVGADLSAGLAVFLVALPLCIGIAVASNAPVYAGIVTGIVGGLVVALISGSAISVSGPAAGLTALVSGAILNLVSYETFLFAVFISGIIQILLGAVRAGFVALFFPYASIRGMLSAIGILLISKQLPIIVGDESLYDSILLLLHPHTWQEFFRDINWTLHDFQQTALFISFVSYLILHFWNKPFFQKYGFARNIPAPLIVVLVGIGISEMLNAFLPAYALSSAQLVQLPVPETFDDYAMFFTFPDFSEWRNIELYKIGFSIAMIASIETLLNVEAADKIDPIKRVTPPNRELVAQGIGNALCGLLGGIPLTSVVVRSSVNVAAGAKSKFSAFFQGILLAVTVFLTPDLLNKIPLPSLAIILAVTGYKLTKVSIFKNMYRLGMSQFVPFMVTIIAIVATDLLKGIAIGSIVSLFYVLRVSYLLPMGYSLKEVNGLETIVIYLGENVSFLNKANLQKTLNQVPNGSNIVINGEKSVYIDYDVIEVIIDFVENAPTRNIKVELVGIAQTEAVDSSH